MHAWTFLYHDDSNDDSNDSNDLVVSDYYAQREYIPFRDWYTCVLLFSYEKRRNSDFIYEIMNFFEVSKDKQLQTRIFT